MSITIQQPRVALDDPHACTDASDVLTVFTAVFETLVTLGADGWVPAVASTWTQSEDARSITLTLRDGVRFHDGEVCDAAAVLANIERMARPDMGATLGAGGVYAQYLAGMRGSVIDAVTLRIETAEPLADILDILGYGHLASPRALAADDTARRLVGSGPYRLEGMVDGERVIASRHDARAAHGEIAWRAVPDADARLEAVASGQAHVANGLPASALSRLDARSLVRTVMPTAIILMFNAAAGPGRDVRVRRALNLAIDREALIRDVLDGLGAPLAGFISPRHDAFDPSAPPVPFDRDEARRLLREAGYGAGLQMTLFAPTRLPDETPRLVAALQKQLADVGVSFVVHVEPDRVRYANRVRTKEIEDICVFDSSPMSTFRVLAEKIDSRLRGSWWQGYQNAAVETLIDQGRRTIDVTRRLAIWRAAFRALQADPPWLVLYNPVRLTGVARGTTLDALRRDGILDVTRIGRTDQNR
jgi:peptide/nickel transport system substrate-binding protein